MRTLHWTIVAAFAIAYATGDDWLTPHVWAGYVLGVAVFIRLLWGLIGPKHARLTDFIFGPTAVNEYLRAVLKFSAPH